MKFRLLCLVAAAGQLVGMGAAADNPAASPSVNNSVAKLPPVLRPSEPADSGQITLPGPPRSTPAPSQVAPAAPQVTPAPPPVASAPKAASPAAPASKAVPVPRTVVENAVVRPPLPLPKVPVAPVPATFAAPAAAPAKSAPVLEVGREVAAYCQKQIGHWKESDARKLLGDPTRHRPAYDEKRAVNGTIYAFNDPSSKYKELELDFDSQSGTLRTVFVYPPRLTWQECRRLWNGPVSAADAAQGRKFYSYTNRRLDVLVDPTGRVISLGWY